jgi:hypothetical protein
MVAFEVVFVWLDIRQDNQDYAECRTVATCMRSFEWKNLVWLQRQVVVRLQRQVWHCDYKDKWQYRHKLESHYRGKWQCGYRHKWQYDYRDYDYSNKLQNDYSDNSMIIGTSDSSNKEERQYDYWWLWLLISDGVSIKI